MNTPSYLTVELLQRAKREVAASPLYTRFINGTPLENDIAVWMADFAGQVLHEAQTSPAPAAAEGPQDEGKPAYVIEIEREVDGRYFASWTSGTEGGCAPYSSTVVGALAELCATLLKVDEDKMRLREEPALAGERTRAAPPDPKEVQEETDETI